MAKLTKEHIWMIVTLIFALIMIAIIIGVTKGIGPSSVMKGKGMICGIYEVICFFAFASCGC